MIPNSYQIELRHLLYFKVTAEELHFRRAAERLFITQPGLSRQIKQLEEFYQTPLFKRNNRNVSLTFAGKFLKNEVDLLFNQLSAIKTQMKNISSGKLTSLKLGFIGSAVQSVLPQILEKLNEQQPLIDITLNELTTEIQMEMLLKNELDFAFVRIRDTPTKFHSIPLVTDHFALVVPKDHPLSKQKEVDLALFKEEPFILFAKEYSESYYHLVMSIFDDFKFQPRVSLKTVNALSIFNLVSKKLGVALVPSSLKKGYHTDVEFLELNHISQRTTIYLLWNKENTNPGIPLMLPIVKQTLAEISHSEPQ